MSMNILILNKLTDVCVRIGVSECEICLNIGMDKRRTVCGDLY